MPWLATSASPSDRCSVSLQAVVKAAVECLLRWHNAQPGAQPLSRCLQAAAVLKTPLSGICMLPELLLRSLTVPGLSTMSLLNRRWPGAIDEAHAERSAAGR